MCRGADRHQCYNFPFFLFLEYDGGGVRVCADMVVVRVCVGVSAVPFLNIIYSTLVLTHATHTERDRKGESKKPFALTAVIRL